MGFPNRRYVINYVPDTITSSILNRFYFCLGSLAMDPKLYSISIRLNSCKRGLYPNLDWSMIAIYIGWLFLVFYA